MGPVAFAASELFADDLFPFVMSAFFANTVSEFRFTAVIASNHAWHLELEVSAALALGRFGCSSFRYCHAGHLLTVLFVFRFIFGPAE